MKTEVFTWNDFDVAIKELAEKIVSSGQVFSNIYGIPRGGLVVAVTLSHRLGLPLIPTIHGVTCDTLVVDDISDSGKALQCFVEYGCAIATLHVAPATRVRPNFFAHVRKSDWIIYPWEVESR